MADLPKYRLKLVPSFTYVVLIFSGSGMSNIARKILKRYSVIFTCMAAIHLEMANYLNTDSFMNALRWFIALISLVQKGNSVRLYLRHAGFFLKLLQSFQVQNGWSVGMTNSFSLKCLCVFVGQFWFSTWWWIFTYFYVWSGGYSQQ